MGIVAQHTRRAVVGGAVAGLTMAAVLGLAPVAAAADGGVRVSTGGSGVGKDSGPGVGLGVGLGTAGRGADIVLRPNGNTWGS